MCWGLCSFSMNNTWNWSVRSGEIWILSELDAVGLYYLEPYYKRLVGGVRRWDLVYFLFFNSTLVFLPNVVCDVKVGKLHLILWWWKWRSVSGGQKTHLLMVTSRNTHSQPQEQLSRDMELLSTPILSDCIWHKGKLFRCVLHKEQEDHPMKQQNLENIFFRTLRSFEILPKFRKMEIRISLSFGPG